jgi:hypothetical protein
MQRLPPMPVPGHLAFNRDAVGWLPKIVPGALRQLPIEAPPATAPAPEQAAAEPLYGLVPNAGALLGLIGILIAFGHSFLAMSDEESLAQVNRELEYPKHRSPVRAGFVIFVYSLLLSSISSRATSNCCPLMWLRLRKRKANPCTCSSCHPPAIAHTAAQLDSAEVIDGPSPMLPPKGQAKHFRKAWENLRDKPKRQICFRIIEPDGNTRDFRI